MPRSPHVSNRQIRLEELQARLDNLPSSLNSSLLSSLLQASAQLKALSEGKRIHLLVERKGLLKLRIVCHGLISMYGKCGCVEDARIVFNGIKRRNVVSWNAMIGAYIVNEHSEDGLKLFKCMRVEGIDPDRVTFMTILSACDSPETLDVGKSIHSQVVDGRLMEDIAVASAVVSMYGKCGDLNLARKVFDGMGNKDVVAWNGLITMYAQHGHPEGALQVYSKMLFEGINANKVTFLVVLNACVSKETLLECRILHATVIEMGVESDVTLGNALLNSYGKCESLMEARKVFLSMPKKDVVSWSTFILVCAQNHSDKEALELFQHMQANKIKPSEVSYVAILSICTGPTDLAVGRSIHASAIDNKLESNVHVGNALLSMYTNCGDANDAKQMFDKIKIPSMVSWNAIISAYDRHGLGLDARQHFWHMLKEGTLPNEFTFASVVSACANSVALEEGNVIHALACESNLESDDVVMNALVSMYGRCGCVDDAWGVFRKISKKTLITWTAMVASWAQQGNGRRALQLFSQMRCEGYEPNEVSFVGILSACSHAGLRDESCYYLVSMCQDYNITPLLVHMCCLVDLFGRLGMLEVSEWIIKEMPFQPGYVEWYTLLCACKSRGDLGRGTWVAQEVLELHPELSAAYVSLSNIYASEGIWELG